MIDLVQIMFYGFSTLLCQVMSDETAYMYGSQIKRKEKKEYGNYKK